MVTAVLNVNAPPFYPSFAWHYHIDEQYYREHPFSPGKKGFVIADSTVQEHEVPDEELFDPSFHPVSKEELEELEAVDEINEFLAELDMLEMHEELHYKLSQKRKDLRSEAVVQAEIRNMIAKGTRPARDMSIRAQSSKQKNRQMKKKVTYVQQPRSMN